MGPARGRARAAAGRAGLTAAPGRRPDPFEYYVLAMLPEAPELTLRMTALAAHTTATLPRLSHVVQRLQDRGLVARVPWPDDGRATNAHLTPAGWHKVRATAPGHVANVRAHVIDALTPEQVRDLRGIGDAILSRVDPDGKLTLHRSL